MGIVIQRGDRVFVALRKQRPPGASKRQVYHAVTPHCRMALCSTEPGYGSWWAEPPVPQVTCPMCLRRLMKL
jgi:hypothetical protein